MVDIALDDVSVAFTVEQHDEPVRALDRLTLHVGSGELLTLVGPSGSGKSTVLRTIAGLETPDHGTVAIDGRIVNAMTPGERDVAFVAQYDTLMPHMTVEQNLGFPLQLRNVSADETSSRVDAEARSLGLWSKLRRRPRQLSSGERQRAALGRATTRRPRAYLFDEPLAGLDAGERDRIRRELRRLQQGLGVTAIYVTHHQRDAMTLGDRVAVMSRGQVIQVDEPMRVWASPADLFVAQFFGQPPLGVLQGRFYDDGTTAWVDISGTALRLHPTQRSAVRAGIAGSQIAVGLRTHAVSVEHHSPATTADARWHRQLPAVVRNVEPMGATTLLALHPPGGGPDGPSVLYASVPPTRHVQRGASVIADLDLSSSFVFDVTTGRRLHPSMDNTA